MSVTINYKNDTLATFRRATKTLTTKGKFLEDDISITDDTTNGSVYQDDDGYVVINDEAGSGLSLLPLNVTENGTYRTNNEDTGYSPVTVNVHTDPTLQSKSVNPTESSLTVKPDTNYDGLSLVTVGAISNTYVGSSVPRMTATNLTVSGSTVTTPSGYYASAVSKNVAGGTATTPGTSVTTNPTITLSNTTGVITASYNATKSITPTVTAGYISAGTAGTVRYSGTATYSLSTLAAKTVTPTEAALTVVSSGYFTTGDVKVAGISSNYVGTNVTRISAADMTHSGGTVTAPSGYYASALTHAVGNGTATTPATTLTFAPAISVDAATGKITATVSGSSNITPTVTAGYVNAGTAGKITVSGSKTLTMSTRAAATITPTETALTIVSSGYYTLGDVKVAGISSTYVGTGVTTRSSANLTVNGATVTAPAGYYSAAAAATVATATQASPTVAISNTTGKITATLAENTGYITGGTTTGTLLLTSVAGTTITPTEAQLTAVARYRWTKGSVYVAGISSTYVGTGVPTGNATNLTANGSTVTVPSGYYSSLVTKNVGAGTATTPGTTLTFAPAISIDAATGKITATVTGSSNITPTVTAGYIAAGTSGTISVTGSNTLTISTKAATTITPTKTVQTAVSAGYYTTGSVKVGAIPADYVVPSGTLTISNRGTYSVASYATVSTSIPGGTFVATITEGNGTADETNISYNNKKYKNLNESFDFTPGGTAIFRACGTRTGINGRVYLDGELIASNEGDQLIYSYTLPANNINIEISQSDGYGYIYIMTSGPAYVIPSGTLSISNNGIFDVKNYMSANVSCIDDNAIMSLITERHFGGANAQEEYDIQTRIFSKLTRVGTYGLTSCYLRCLDFPNVSIISDHAFYNASTTAAYRTYSFPICTAICSSAFLGLKSSFYIEAPMCSTIYKDAFYSTQLLCASFPSLTNLGVSAFGSTHISEAFLPMLQLLPSYVFSRCGLLKSVYIPACTTIGVGAFAYCRTLSTIDIPMVSSIYSGAFESCGIQSINAPKCTTISTNAFASCTSLATASFSTCVTIWSSAFKNCQSLIVFSIPETCVSIGSYAFTGCTSLESVYIHTSSVPSAYLGIFNNTPISNSTYLGHYGSIYVKSSLLASFKTAANWSAYSARMVGF